MSKNSGKWEAKSRKWSASKVAYCLLLTAYCLLAVGCRYDMQDQPRYKYYKQSDFFADGRASRDLPEGTVSRGNLRDNKAFYTGKIDNPNPNAAAETTTDASGNTLVSSFPNAIAKIPVPVTKELIDRGQERYNIYCIVCHGPVGSGDGMVVRRGYPQPPTYHDDRLRNAPDGHFFDVITNGWGKMNSYAHQVPVADRWAIVAYIRALQVSQNPNGNATMTANTQANTAANRANTNAATAPAPATGGAANANTQGGAR
ncbi:MAG: quinol:cytochrome c oxidoreductase monoheme cytochrome subunit [Acidobacteria bacterium]|jgi:mono/diheme cytochrome c family protein|nr:quinol:cytochrome c oxidoreductase monoheme cytochrome subunit [Acidobacteriota bacterium]